MAKLLLADAAKYFRDKGDLAMTKNFFYQGCRSGYLPHYKIGNRYVVDTQEIESFMASEMRKSVKQQEEFGDVLNYGKLRPVKA